VCCVLLHTQGYILGQYGLLHALRNEAAIERLFILNTPLATSSKLRPELAAYKAPLPFMRPGNVRVACQADGTTHSCCLHLRCSFVLSLWLSAVLAACLVCPLQKPFDGAAFNMAGSPYAMMFADAMVYAQPYKVRREACVAAVCVGRRSRAALTATTTTTTTIHTHATGRPGRELSRGSHDGAGGL
jgi:hypothetical protein